MGKWIIAFLFFVCVFGAVSSPRPVHALAGIPLAEDPGEVTHVLVSGQYYPEFTSLKCDNGFAYDFYNIQLMTVPGVGAVWVGVDSKYSPGYKTAALQFICEKEGEDTVYVYGLDSCEC